MLDWALKLGLRAICLPNFSLRSRYRAADFIWQRFGLENRFRRDEF
ncbi:MAG: hypothetical protein SW833_13505 [Cyanobacteriota bacterium]|nr:hypothetical protein [Cyanobacteriota bacterium]